MSNENETWMQIRCKAACPHHHELQPNWLFDQNRVRNRYSSILQLHNGSADMIAKTSLCAKTVSLFAKQTTRLSMCNTCCGDRKGFIRRILLRQQTNYQKSLANTFVREKLSVWNIVHPCPQGRYTQSFRFKLVVSYKSCMKPSPTQIFGVAYLLTDFFPR